VYRVHSRAGIYSRCVHCSTINPGPVILASLGKSANVQKAGPRARSAPRGAAAPKPEPEASPEPQVSPAPAAAPEPEPAAAAPPRRRGWLDTLLYGDQ
jgi:hypothetical protein